MITTKDGVVKKRGEEIWVCAKTKRGRRVPMNAPMHENDPALKVMDCWHSREECQKECDRLNGVCPDCGGTGAVVSVNVGTRCCGYATARGECCGRPETKEIQVQSQCERCQATGVIG